MTEPGKAQGEAAGVGLGPWRVRPWTEEERDGTLPWQQVELPRESPCTTQEPDRSPEDSGAHAARVCISSESGKLVASGHHGSVDMGWGGRMVLKFGRAKAEVAGEEEPILRTLSE